MTTGSTSAVFRTLSSNWQRSLTGEEVRTNKYGWAAFARQAGEGRVSVAFSWGTLYGEGFWAELDSHGSLQIVPGLPSWRS